MTRSNARKSTGGRRCPSPPPNDTELAGTTLVENTNERKVSNGDKDEETPRIPPSTTSGSTRGSTNKRKKSNGEKDKETPRVMRMKVLNKEKGDIDGIAKSEVNYVCILWLHSVADTVILPCGHLLMW